MQESIFIRDLAIVLLVAAGVGWAIQRIKLSAVVGYLLAGVLIGPFSPFFKVISDVRQVELLSQFGLIFLMFAIGLGLSLARLQRMGLSVLVAVAISSIVLFNICRWFGSAMDWSALQIVFLGGTLMISSSAIVIKVLDELNITHQRAGQLALGFTVLEDIVAVVMLSLFISMMKVGAGGSAPVWGVLGTLSAFVVFMMVVGMLLTPRLLKLLSRDTNSELRVVAVTGLVLVAALSAFEAGYSLALGAFVMGVVVAGTRFKDELENGLGSLHTIFGAVFFVSVGMMFDYRLLAQVWWLVLLVTALTVAARPLACAFGLVAVGHSSRNAAKAGISLIPIGEFAFVMIQVAKSSNVLPESFYALAIGVSFTTAIIGPILTRRAEGISDWIERHEPRAFGEAISAYHRWLEALHLKSNASLLWRLVRARVFHILFHLLFVSALILFSKSIHDTAFEYFGKAFPRGFDFMFWSAFGAVLLGPVIVLWKNLEALAMIAAEGAAGRTPRAAMLRPFLEFLLKALAILVIAGWLLMLVPIGRWAMVALSLAGLGILLYAPAFWKRMVSLHGKMEVDLREKMKTASTLGATKGLPTSVLEQPQEWDLQIDEVTLPTGSEHAGKSISDLGIRANFSCSVMVIDRNGFLITNPTANERLFSGDKLLLLGTPAQLPLADQFLRGSGVGSDDDDEFADINMETIEVPAGSPEVGKTLFEFNSAARFEIQICGIYRDGIRIPVPSSNERIAAGDVLLALGTHERIQALGDHFAETAASKPLM